VTKHVRVLFAVRACAALVAAGSLAARADEGMWTFDNPPVKQLKEKYGFTPTQEWLDHVRLASVRFNDGGSGSFVSPDGLVLTNHHVARGQLQKVSSKEHDYTHTGFYAATRDQEMRCPDLELNVLVSMEDVTDRVLSAVKPGMSDEEALRARKARIAEIEKESLEKTGLRSDVVTLYHGGEYWLYRYKKYTDIRLVFAPEDDIAFFGGDPDNFTYPRYDLDMAIFRVYEDGKPIRSPAWLRWNPAGPKAGDLVFVSGHPGSTDRLYTYAQLEYLRDYSYPVRLDVMKKIVKVLEDYAAEGSEQRRQATGMLFGLRNAIKAYTGEYEGLLDEHLMEKKKADEEAFRAKVMADPELKKKYGDAWSLVERAIANEKKRLEEFRWRRLPWSRMAGTALTIVRYVEEVQKPDGERLDGFHDSQLDSLRFRMFSPAPVYPAMEERIAASFLEMAREHLGDDDPFIQAALGGKSPQEVAHELFSQTKIGDPAFRRKLVEGGKDAVAKCDDPLIAWVRKLDPMLRELRKWHEENVEALQTIAGEKLGQARFAVYGKSTYPDATFTLRLAYGTVKGYPMNGTQAPPFTTFYGLFDRTLSFDRQPPWSLPERWNGAEKKLDLATRLDFVSTCDIIGGNSGSPVIDREGRLVGLIFDGNIESLVGRFVYDERTNRAVAVHTGGMIEALRKIYHADALVKELLGK